MAGVGAYNWMHALTISCPYGCGQEAFAFVIDEHVVKCRQLWIENGGRDLKICPFNRLHHVPVPEYQYHLDRCGGGSAVELQAVENSIGSTKSKLNVNAPVFTPRSSSNGSSCSSGTGVTGGVVLPLTEHVPKTDPQYLPRGATAGGYTSVDLWLNAQSARQNMSELTPTNTTVGAGPAKDDYANRYNNHQIQNFEQFELFPKTRRPTVVALEDLIDLECRSESRPGVQRQAGLAGFRSVASSTTGSSSQPQSERASPDSDTPRPPQFPSFDPIDNLARAFDQMTANPFAMFSGPAKTSGLEATLEAWKKIKANSGGHEEDSCPGGQHHSWPTPASLPGSANAQWSAWSSGVGEQLLPKGYTGF